MPRHPLPAVVLTAVTSIITVSSFVQAQVPAPSPGGASVEQGEDEGSERDARTGKEGGAGARTIPPAEDIYRDHEIARLPREQPGVPTSPTSQVHVEEMPLPAPGQGHEPPEERAEGSAVRPAGPALAALGAGFLIAGSTVAAVGAGIRKCNSDACSRSRLGLLLGGGATAALFGGLGLGLGLRLVNEDLGEAPDEVEAPHADPGMYAVGITSVTVGAAALGVGFFASFLGSHTPSIPSQSTYGLPNPTQPLLIVSGATLLALGVPLLSLGKRRVPPDGPTVSFDVGPGGAVMQGSF